MFKLGDRAGDTQRLKASAERLVERLQTEPRTESDRQQMVHHVKEIEKATGWSLIV
jgi:hypothetical protein